MTKFQLRDNNSPTLRILKKANKRQLFPELREVYYSII